MFCKLGVNTNAKGKDRNCNQQIITIVNNNTHFLQQKKCIQYTLNINIQAFNNKKFCRFGVNSNAKEKDIKFLQTNYNKNS